jgi:hypothetical protein
VEFTKRGSSGRGGSAGLQLGGASMFHLKRALALA